MTIKEVLEQKNPVLIDVRTPVEFQGGSVENAVNIPMNEVVNRFDEFQKSQPIIVFCRSGARSEQVMHYLKEKGISMVWNGGGWLDLNALINA
jgi:phage shock protein E